MVIYQISRKHTPYSYWHIQFRQFFLINLQLSVYMPFQPPPPQKKIPIRGSKSLLYPYCRKQRLEAKADKKAAAAAAAAASGESDMAPAPQEVAGKK